MNMRIPINDNKIIYIEVDFVQANVPFLMGLDLLDSSLYVNNETNKLVAPYLAISTPLVRKRGHIYLEWNKKIQFSIQDKKY